MENFKEKKLAEFEKKFCNNHQKPIRFLRSIFFNTQDGAEQIEQFISNLIDEMETNLFLKDIVTKARIDTLKAVLPITAEETKQFSIDESIG
jgi:hypothetical protein